MTTAPLARHLLRARDLVDSRYAEPLDLEALARAAHVSPRHFSRSFRATFGETPHQYLLTRRIERARHLLRTTDLKVAEVCLAMIDEMSHVGVWVHDQDEAKAFYTEKLGFEVREDATLEEFGGYRWLTVGPPGQPELNLILSRPAPPALDPEAAEQVLALVAKGAMGGGIFRTKDCRATCRELEARGLELAQHPVERFYGIDATFRDPSGNLWRIVQQLDSA